MILFLCSLSFSAEHAMIRALLFCPVLISVVASIPSISGIMISISIISYSSFSHILTAFLPSSAKKSSSLVFGFSSSQSSSINCSVNLLFLLSSTTNIFFMCYPLFFTLNYFKSKTKLSST